MVFTQIVFKTGPPPNGSGPFHNYAYAMCSQLRFLRIESGRQGSAEPSSRFRNILDVDALEVYNLLFLHLLKDGTTKSQICISADRPNRYQAEKPSLFRALEKTQRKQASHGGLIVQCHRQRIHRVKVRLFAFRHCCHRYTHLNRADCRFGNSRLLSDFAFAAVPYRPD